MKRKFQILQQLHAIYLSASEDMDFIASQMDKVFAENGLTYHILGLINTSYLLPDITDLRSCLYYHMNTSLCKEFPYFAGLVDDFIDFIPAIVAERLNTPAEAFNVVEIYNPKAA